MTAALLTAAQQCADDTRHRDEAVRDEIARVIATRPDELRRSLTCDQGSEMAQHAQLRIDAGLEVDFCDPHSPWQRGTNENTNGLLRQYFPKGTDLHRHSRDDLDAVALALSTDPAKRIRIIKGFQDQWYARIAEQAVINKYGRISRDSGRLYNLRNSIAPPKSPNPPKSLGGLPFTWGIPIPICSGTFRMALPRGTCGDGLSLA